MKRMTQNEEILTALLTGRHLTQFDALYEFGCMRLASRVSDLNKARRNGDKSIPFIHRRLKKIVCTNGRIAHVAKYYIQPDDVKGGETNAVD